jgi:hypothetical protein
MTHSKWIDGPEMRKSCKTSCGIRLRFDVVAEVLSIFERLSEDAFVSDVSEF